MQICIYMFFPMQVPSFGSTNGIAPSATYGNDYEEPITLNASATVKAVAIVNGVASEVASKAFVKNGSSGGGGEEGM